MLAKQNTALNDKFIRKVSEISFKSYDMSQKISELEGQKEYNKSSKQLIKFEDIPEDKEQKLSIRRESKEDLSRRNSEKPPEVKKDIVQEKYQKAASLKIPSSIDMKKKTNEKTINVLDNNHLLQLLTSQAYLNEKMMKRENK